MIKGMQKYNRFCKILDLWMEIQPQKCIDEFGILRNVLTAHKDMIWD